MQVRIFNVIRALPSTSPQIITFIPNTKVFFHFSGASGACILPLSNQYHSYVEQLCITRLGVVG